MITGNYTLSFGVHGLTWHVAIVMLAIDSYIEVMHKA